MDVYSTSMNAPAASLAIDEALYLAQQRRLALQRRMLPVLGIVGLLIAWWAVIAGFNIKPFIAPSPLLVMQTIIQKSDLLLQNLGVTALEALFGFIFGNLAAILVATAIGRKIHCRILLLIMGNGMAPKITIAAMVCFFP